MIKFVMGGIGQYNRAKKKNGKQTKHTAPSPYGLPRPSPAEMYLCGVEKEPGKKSLEISDIPHDKPNQAPREGAHDSSHQSECCVSAKAR